MVEWHAVFLQTGALRLRRRRAARSFGGAFPPRPDQLSCRARSPPRAIPPARWLELFRVGAPATVTRHRSPRRCVLDQNRDPKSDSFRAKLIALPAEFCR